MKQFNTQKWVIHVGCPVTLQSLVLRPPDFTKFTSYSIPGHSVIWSLQLGSEIVWQNFKSKPRWYSSIKTQDSQCYTWLLIPYYHYNQSLPLTLTFILYCNHYHFSNCSCFPAGWFAGPSGRGGRAHCVCCCGLGGVSGVPWVVGGRRLYCR